MSERPTYEELERVVAVLRDNIKDLLEINQSAEFVILQQSDALDQAVDQLHDFRGHKKSKEAIRDELNKMGVTK